MQPGHVSGGLPVEGQITVELSVRHRSFRDLLAPQVVPVASVDLAPNQMPETLICALADHSVLFGRLTGRRCN